LGFPEERALLVRVSAPEKSLGAFENQRRANRPRLTGIAGPSYAEEEQDFIALLRNIPAEIESLSVLRLK
jgi:hypothetical protein